MNKRILSGLAAMALVFSTAAVPAFADEVDGEYDTTPSFAVDEGAGAEFSDYSFDDSAATFDDGSNEATVAVEEPVVEANVDDADWNRGGFGGFYGDFDGFYGYKRDFKPTKTDSTKTDSTKTDSTKPSKKTPTIKPNMYYVYSYGEVYGPNGEETGLPFYVDFGTPLYNNFGFNNFGFKKCGGVDEGKPTQAAAPKFFGWTAPVSYNWYTPIGFGFNKELAEKRAEAAKKRAEARKEAAKKRAEARREAAKKRAEARKEAAKKRAEAAKKAAEARAEAMKNWTPVWNWNCWYAAPTAAPKQAKAAYPFYGLRNYLRTVHNTSHGNSWNWGFVKFPTKK